MNRERFTNEMVDWLQRRLVPPGVTVAADTHLFEARLIDSIAILKLIAWTEQAIGREIADNQIRMDNFQSVDRIAQVFLEESICVLSNRCSKSCAAAANCGSPFPVRPVCAAHCSRCPNASSAN